MPLDYENLCQNYSHRFCAITHTMEYGMYGDAHGLGFIGQKNLKNQKLKFEKTKEKEREGQPWEL